MTSRILLVEDDPVSREVVSSLLSSRGYRVETAEDGFNALRLAQEQTYDLVFVDYHLPEMDGYALARLMRSLAETSKRPLKMVAITADQFGLAARRGVDTIFDRVVSKPIEPDTLFGLVDDFLGKTDALDELESFLAPSSEATDTRDPALALWRARGLDRVPAACVFPVPTRAERTNLEACFRIVDTPAMADLLLLAAPEGLPAIEDLRQKAKDFLLPLVALDSRSSDIADALFEPSNGHSWDLMAQALAGFASRRRQLKAAAVEGAPMEIRLAAYLLLAERQLELTRSTSGETLARYTAGFSLAAIVAGVKLLAAQGLIVPELKPSANGEPRRLVLSLSPSAVASLMPQSQSLQGLHGQVKVEML